MNTKFTQGPFEARNEAGAGWQIYANVNLGVDEHEKGLQPIYHLQAEPSLRVNKDGSVTAMISYESWRQFASLNFQTMQAANAILFAASPEMFSVLDAWSKAHWLAGTEPVENSNDPSEALLFRTRSVLESANPT